MDENKNQTPSISPNGIVVKDVDGIFKVLSDGELKELDALLSSTEKEVPKPVTATAQGGIVDFPKFTDLAVVPADEHFQVPDAEKKVGRFAEHHFHPDDKAEIERELEKINLTFGLGPQKQYSISKIAQKLIDKHGLKLSESEQTLIRKILLSYFRQARSLVETRSALLQPKPTGGLGINSETVDHMISVLQHLKMKIEENDGIVVEAEDLPPVPVIRPTFASTEQRPILAPTTPVQTKPVTPSLSSTLASQPSIQKIVPEPQALPKIEASVPTVTVAAKVPQPVPQQSAPRPPIDMPSRQPSKPVAKPEQTPVVDIPVINRPQVSAIKPPMNEIKRPIVNAVKSGKPTGRVDELALMDLTTWRMLDPDPRIRAGKILGKIQNLEQESLTRKSEGIQAWRSNEVYQFYLMIGQMSLEHKQQVADVIKSLTSQGQQTLTLDEFEAISDLNRMLRY